MKFRFVFLYRATLVLLFVIAFWSVWANAQTSTTVVTNTPENPVTVTAAAATNQYHAVTFGLDKVDFLKENTVLAQPLWKYVASLIYICLAFCVAWLLDYVVMAWLHRLAAKTETKYDDLLLNLMRGPIKVVAFVILMNIGLSMFEWPPRVQTLLARGFIVVVACSVTYVSIKIVDLLLTLWRERISLQDRAFAAQLFPLLSKATKVVIAVVAVVMTADNLGIKITSFLAGLSVGGLALGLAAQDTVANLFGAVSIFIDKPFHLGDFVRIDGAEGTVESIGLRSTRVRSPDGHHVTVPNKVMGNAVITNVTRRPSIRTEMNFGLTYDTTVERVRLATKILEEIYRNKPQTSDLIISFNKFADSSLNIYVRHTWAGTDLREHFAQMQEWNLEIMQRFANEKIEFAFPTQTIQLKQVGK